MFSLSGFTDNSEVKRVDRRHNLRGWWERRYVTDGDLENGKCCDTLHSLVGKDSRLSKENSAYGSMIQLSRYVILISISYQSFINYISRLGGKRFLAR